MFNDQFAFVNLPGRGVTSALTLINCLILRHLETPGAVRLLFIDFAKAFDSVSHSRILDTLLSVGVPAAIVFWVKSYLSNRYQRVKSHNSFSEWLEVPSGVPQGSIIGPPLFAIFIASLRTLCSCCRLVKYADDVTVMNFVRDPADDHILETLSHISQWCESNFMRINFSKTNLMDIITKSSLSLRSSESMTCVRVVRLLGVIHSDSLKWNNHIDHAIKRASKLIFCIFCLKRSGVSSVVLWSVYEAIIRSVLVFAFPAFCNLSNYLRQRLCAFEKRVSRIIGSQPSKSITDFCDMLCRRLSASVNSDSGHPLRELCSKIPASAYSLRRRQTTLRPPCAKTERFKNSFIRFI